eukprot:Hpha_TRINITY_DN8056_c0_g1::TRINITY_DN8056_c0_g1_i1::g.140130::m.140130
MSRIEWAGLVSSCPKLLDAVFWRTVIAAQDKERHSRVEAVRQRVAELEERVDETKDRVRSAEAAVLEMQGEVRDRCEGLDSAAKADTEAKCTRDTAMSRVHAARETLRDTENAREHLRDEAQQAESSCRNAARELQLAEQKHDLERAQTKSLLQELEDLRQRLKEKEAELEEREAAQGDAAMLLERARVAVARSREDRERAEQDLSVASAQCAFQEKELRGFLDAERLRTRTQQETTRACVAAQVQRASGEKDLSQARMRHAAAKEAEATTIRELSDHRRHVAALERRELEIAQRRLLEEGRESAVLEQEFQRFQQERALPEQEAALKSLGFPAPPQFRLRT